MVGYARLRGPLIVRRTPQASSEVDAMGYHIKAYRIDWARLSRVYGSRDHSLAKTVASLHGGLDEPYYDLDEDEVEELGEVPGYREAMKSILDGGPFTEVFPEVYIAALELLVWHLGQRLDDMYLSSRAHPVIGMTETALKDLGVADRLSLYSLVFRGAPFPLPETGDFPTMGFLDPGEVAAAHSVARTVQVDRLPEAVRGVVQHLDGWLSSAARAGEGLVCVYD
jgi:hypothetical protein